MYETAGKISVDNLCIVSKNSNSCGKQALKICKIFPQFSAHDLLAELVADSDGKVTFFEGELTDSGE